MTRYISDYTTVGKVVRQLEKADPENVPSSQQVEYNEFFTLVKELATQVSQYITNYTGRVFVPYKETKNYYFSEMRYGDRFTSYRGLPTLYLDEDCLLVSSITWDGTALSASYFREYPERELPYYAIRFDPANLESWGTSFGDSVAIDATWGYHTNLSQAYTDSSDTTVTFADATGTSVTVGNTNDYDILQYIRCESELMQITDKPNATTLTVKRGVNGHTSAAHSSQTLEFYEPVESLALAATRLTAWAYQHRNDLGDRIQFADGSSVISEVPSFVRETLNFYARQSIKAV